MSSLEVIHDPMNSLGLCSGFVSLEVQFEIAFLAMHIAL